MKNFLRHFSCFGVSLVELQVSLLIASILVLTIGAIAGVSQTSFRKARYEASVYNDLTYVFKKIQSRVRSAVTEIDSEDIVLRQAGDDKELVYFSQTGNEEVLFSFKKYEELNLVIENLQEKVMVTLEGIKDDVPFKLSSTVIRRMP